MLKYIESILIHQLIIFILRHFDGLSLALRLCVGLMLIFVLLRKDLIELIRSYGLILLERR